MIKGIGTDIIEIDRIEKALGRSERFMHRIFTTGEISIFAENQFRISQIAGNFAAKEAVMKALGTGLRRFNWESIEINRDELGKPYVILHDKAKSLAEEMEIEKILISISHSKKYAVAQAILC